MNCAPTFDVTDNLSYRILWRDRDIHMNVTWHMTFPQPDFHAALPIHESHFQVSDECDHTAFSYAT